MLSFPTLRRSALRVGLLLIATLAFTACDSGGGGGDGGPGAPNANAGPDQTADVGTPVTLDASASTDPDGDALTFSWAFMTTPPGSAVTLAASSATTSFTPDAPGAYVARVTVSDGTNSDTDDVAIMVDQPIITDLTDDIDGDVTLPAGVYRVPAGTRIDVQSGSLTLAPGVRIDFGAGAGLQVNSAGAIIANGTASQPIILQGQSPAAGFWSGVAVYSNDPRNAMTFTTVAHGGGVRYSLMGAAANVSLDNNAQLRLSNSTVRDGGAFGLSLDLGATLPSFSANTFSGNAEAGVQLDFEAAGQLDAASAYAANGDAYISVTDTDANDDVTLVAADAPFRFGANVAVSSSALLTVSPGATLLFASGAGLQMNSDGALRAVGTAAQPIVFQGEVQNPGFWDGIAVYSNDPRNAMAFATVAHGGNARYSLMGEAANISLDNSAQLRLSNSTVRDGSAFGLSLDLGATLPSFSANTFSGNAEAGVHLNFEAAGQLDAASAYAANGDAYISVTDTDANDDVTLVAADAPFRFSANVAVTGGALLTVSPGATLLFASGAGLQMNSDGALRAVGTASSRVTIRGEQPAQGFWDGIAIYSNDSRNVFDFATIAHGGGARYSLMGEAANIALDDNAQASITNSSITDSADWGIQADRGVTLTQSGNTFSNNASGDVNQD